eukprot:s2168_g4.t2
MLATALHGAHIRPSALGHRWMASSPGQLRKLLRRAKLLGAELQDWSHERQMLWRAKLKDQFQVAKDLKKLPPGELVERCWDQMLLANRRFDDRFNAAFYRIMDALMARVKEVQRRGATEHCLAAWQQSRARLQLLKLLQGLGLEHTWRQVKDETSRASSRQISGKARSKADPWLDAGVITLIGMSVGSAMHGFYFYSLLFSTWSCLRSLRRFVVLCLDTEDANRLFRYAPTDLKKRKMELFNWLHFELNAMRQIRAGNLHYIGRVGEKDWDWVHDPKNDHGPETLFDLAMEAVANHPRVHEWVGAKVLPKAEPDKAVYRMHEGIAETFLGWTVKGELGEAEIQVKSIGSLVDFIYVFPQGRDHYGLVPPGFVIRPNGDTWSQDETELPNDMKRPFGKHGEGTIFEREGIFDWDYKVGAFRTGLERDQDHPREKAYRRWFG